MFKVTELDMYSYQQRSREVYGALASMASWHSKVQNNWDKNVISGVF